MQNRFAAIVQKVEGIKIRYRHTLADLENLYSALSQKAFKGELDLSRVVLAKEQVTITEDVKLVIREVTETKPKPAIELLAPDNPNDLNNADGRKAVIGKWLDAYLAQLNGSAFSVEQFMEVAQQRLWDLQENGAVELGVGEYDHVKDWVFRALGSCRLRQGYDKSSNLMRIVLTKGR